MSWLKFHENGEIVQPQSAVVRTVVVTLDLEKDGKISNMKNSFIYYLQSYLL